MAYEAISEYIRDVRYNLERLAGTKHEALAEIDPTRVLYNALVPFAVARATIPA
jgi:hypothetical protein